MQRSGVIIHEVGHNYFPMIVNPDERQWTWMDEWRTFYNLLQKLNGEELSPSSRASQSNRGLYEAGSQILEPIMTNSEKCTAVGILMPMPK